MIDKTYWLKPGESIQNYNMRIDAYNNSQPITLPRPQIKKPSIVSGGVVNLSNKSPNKPKDTTTISSIENNINNKVNNLAGVDTNYQLKPGENISDYNQRISNYNQQLESQNTQGNQNNNQTQGTDNTKNNSYGFNITDYQKVMDKYQIDKQAQDLQKMRQRILAASQVFDDEINRIKNEGGVPESIRQKRINLLTQGRDKNLKELELQYNFLQNSYNSSLNRAKYELGLMEDIANKQYTIQQQQKRDLATQLNDLIRTGALAEYSQSDLQQLANETGYDVKQLSKIANTIKKKASKYDYMSTQKDENGNLVIIGTKKDGTSKIVKKYSGFGKSGTTTETKPFWNKSDYKELSSMGVPNDVSDTIAVALQQGLSLEAIRRALAEVYGKDKGYHYLDVVMPYIQSKSSNIL